MQVKDLIEKLKQYKQNASVEFKFTEIVDEDVDGNLKEIRVFTVPGDWIDIKPKYMVMRDDENYKHDELVFDFVELSFDCGLEDAHIFF